MKSYSVSELEKMLAEVVATQSVYPSYREHIIRLIGELLALKQAQEWIPVEQLPERNEHVLIATRYLGVRDGILLPWTTSGLKIDYDWYSDGRHIEHVTHWRPLPAPPSPLPGGIK